MNDKCPKCDYKPLKYWSELTEDEKLIASLKLKPTEIDGCEELRICVRCWTTQSIHSELA